MISPLLVRCAAVVFNVCLDVCERLQAYRGLGAEIDAHRQAAREERLAMARIETYRTGR